MKQTFIAESYVLDNGIVRLIDFMGDDLSIMRAARVSHDAAWRAGDNAQNDRKLMKRLWRGKPDSLLGPNPLPELPKHSTPFEACTMTFEVLAPIFVFRQWHRHRTQSYNELSARYRELPEFFYVPEPNYVGMQDPDNRQGRVDAAGEMLDIRDAECLEVRAHCEASFRLYRRLIGSGWPNELARIVLPMGTYSHMFATMNLLNFFKFANLRADPHAQKEIRVYAEAMVEMVFNRVPEATSLFKAANPGAHT